MVRGHDGLGKLEKKSVLIGFHSFHDAVLEVGVDVGLFMAGTFYGLFVDVEKLCKNRFTPPKS